MTQGGWLLKLSVLLEGGIKWVAHSRGRLLGVGIR